MKSLFEAINDISVDDDFSVHFSYLNLSKGWNLIKKIEADQTTRNKLIKYVALCYSYESPLLRKKKERWSNKIAVCDMLQLDMDSYVLGCIENKNDEFNRYISWWLRTSQDREFALVISAEDLMYELLEVARQGIEKKIVATSSKDAERALKIFSKTEVIIKADAFDRAMKVKENIESQLKTLEKNYEYLYKAVKEDSPDISGNMNWAELMVIRSRNRNK